MKRDKSETKTREKKLKRQELLFFISIALFLPILVFLVKNLHQNYEEEI